MLTCFQQSMLPLRDPPSSWSDTPPIHIPKLAVRNRIDPDVNSFSTTSPPTDFEQWRAEQARAAASTPPGDQTHNLTHSLPDARQGKAKKAKKLGGLMSFLTLKEPSASALEDYTQQIKAQNPQGARGVPFSDKKLPADVPKVNSKWDGMPGSSPNARPTSRNGLWGTITLPHEDTRLSTSQKPTPVDHPHHVSVAAASLCPNGEGSAVQSIPSPPARPGLDASIAPKESSEAAPHRRPGASLTVESTPDFSAAASDTSSPRMPLTPDQPGPAFEFSSVPHRGPSFESGRAWPPVVPSPLHEPPSEDPPRRPSIEALLVQRAESGKFNYSHSFDGTSTTRLASAPTPTISPRKGLQSSSPIHTKSSSKPSIKSPLKPPPTPSPAEDGAASAWYSSDEEDDMDALDIPRKRPIAEPPRAVTPPPSFSRTPPAQETPSPPNPSSFYPTSSDIASPTKLPKNPSPIRSFSRPLPFTGKVSQPKPPPAESGSAMGTISIIRDNKPLPSEPDLTYSSSSTSSSSSPLLYIPPRFQPGRVKIKDSDLDTIAESDSVRSLSRRASHISGVSEGDKNNSTEAIPTVPSNPHFLRPLGGSTSLRSSLCSSVSGGADAEQALDAGFSGHESETPHLDHNHDTDFDQNHHRFVSIHTDQDGDAVSIAESRASAASNMSEQWFMSPRERLGLGGFIRHSTTISPWPEDEPAPGGHTMAPGLLSVNGASAKSSLPASVNASGRASVIASGRGSVNASGRQTPHPPGLVLSKSQEDELKGSKGADGGSVSGKRGFFGVLKMGKPKLIG